MAVTSIRALMHQAQSRPESAAIEPKAKSSLVRRLVAAQNDPAKQRIRIWLTDLDDHSSRTLA
jgi:hypothetical protein